MDIFSLQFLYALGTIILIDLVLAGDNAIVIALAARKLPVDQQKRAILWGTAGAIVVRALMTVAVVGLLKIPGLQLAGGALLLWIAVKLLKPNDKNLEDGHGKAADNFWGAMKTIVIADAVMGLDNVLAVAGASHGSFLLVVLGLLISIPIVVWGSTLILTWVERFPIIVYLGAGVLAFTAAKMMLGEPLVQPWLADFKALTWPLIGAIVAATLAVGHWLSRSASGDAGQAGEARAQGSQDLPALDPSGVAPIAARSHMPTALLSSPDEIVAVSAASSAAAAASLSAMMSSMSGQQPVLDVSPVLSNPSDSTPLVKETSVMEHSIDSQARPAVLIPVDDTPQSLAAVRSLITSGAGRNTQVHLLHVTPRLSRHITRFLPKGARARFVAERAIASIEPAAKLLETAGIPFGAEVKTSDSVVGTILATAKQRDCSRILIGSRRSSALSRLLSHSVSARLLSRSPVPVEIVIDGQASFFSRWVLPAGASAALIALIAD